jgi:hypothetical protein
MIGVVKRKEDFLKRLKNDRYQVFLFICPATFPFSFATHPWFAVNRKGTVSRYGVSRQYARKGRRPLFGQHVCDGCIAHVHKDGRPPSEGIEIVPLSKNHLWKGRVLGLVEGGEGSVAEQMVTLIQRSPSIYPFSQVYLLQGPNSNTYVQWVLNQFPESGLKLPWNALGKGKVTYVKSSICRKNWNGRL